MRLQAAIVGELREVMADELRAAERAVTSGVRAASDGLKTELRGQVTMAGLGTRLANTWRGEVYPKGSPASAPPAMSGRRRRTSSGSMPKAG